LAKKVCIFIDGCFWHGCPEHYVRPRSRDGFWADKLRANVCRDLRQTRELSEAGWLVLRFWEHEVEVNPTNCVDKVTKALMSRRPVAPGSRRVLLATPADREGGHEYRVLVATYGGRYLRLVMEKRHTRKWKRQS
jgi:DNA mismatch endonuclease (patch repair protein)